MTSPVRKGRRADPSKDEAILEAASALFTERGYGVSIDEIASAAGVSKQTIYARYDCKHDLLAAVIHRTAEDLVSPLSIGASSPEEALMKFGERFIEVVFSPAKVAMQRLIIAEAAQFPDLARAYYESGPQVVRDKLAAYIERAAASGKLEASDAALAASQFLGLIIGADHMKSLMGIGLAGGGQSRRAQLRAAVDAFLRLYARE
jgi:TetR/AcrR family transcriptional repressor of mexJK operon